MNKTILSFFLTFFIAFALYGNNGNDCVCQDKDFRCKTAKKVFEDLVEAKGDKRMPVPCFEIRNSKKAVAYMNGKKRIVGLEVAAYEICRKFGKDSLNAMASLLGHELTHYYEKHIWGKKFYSAYGSLDVAVDIRNLSGAEAQRKAQETQSDYLGGFLAHSAGYNTFGIMGRVIDEVYRVYDLPDEIPNYPSKADRKKLAEESDRQLKELIQYYETANLLLLSGMYEDADRYYEKVLSVFQGREVYNNAGVNASMAALKCILYDKKVDYAYPFELDAESRIMTEDRGNFGFANKEDYFFSKALDYFERAEALDRNYSAAYINQAAVYSLMKKQRHADFFADQALEIAEANKEVYSQEKAYILKGIIAHQAGNAANAKRFLNKALSLNSDSRLAKINLAVVEGKSNLDVINTMGVRTKINSDDDSESIDVSSPGVSGARKTELIDGLSLNAFAQTMDFDFYQVIDDEMEYGRKDMNNAKIMMNMSMDEPEEHYAIFGMTGKNYTGETKLGIKLGDDYKKVVQAYGSPSRTIASRNGFFLMYDRQRIIFTVRKSKVVSWAVTKVKSKD